MTVLANRAAALAELIDRTGPRSAPDLASALIECCGDLVDAGEPNLAIDLIARFDPEYPPRNEVDLALATVRVRALRVSGRYEEGLRLAQTIFVSPEPGIVAERFLPLRVAEAACLWQMNR